MEISNNVLAVLVLLAMVFSIVGTGAMMLAVEREPLRFTGFQTTEQTGTALVELESEVGISLEVATVDFGLIDNIEGTQNDTTDYSPHPFVIRNNGTVLINISVAEDSGNTLWGNDDDYEYAFQFNSTRNGSSSGAVAYAGFTNFDQANMAENATAGQVVTDPANLVYNLTTDTTGKANDVTVHINISVPGGGELAGQKSTSVFFKAAQA